MQFSEKNWNDGLVARNLPELFAERATPEQNVFAICDDGRHFTYGAFWELTGRLAGALKSAGASRGDRVAVQVEKSIEALALSWACFRSGLIFLPLNAAYPPAEVAYFLADAAPAVIVVAPEREAVLKSIAADAGCRHTLTLDDTGGGSLMSLIDAAGPSSVDVPSTWQDIAAILYTSGTTGKSKGAMLSHGNLASNAMALIGLWRMSPDDRLIHALPVYHTHGLFTATNTVLLSGGQLLFRRKFVPEDVLALMPHATALMGVPTFYTRLLQHDGLNRDVTANMRVFIAGSAPLLAETHKAFSARTGHAILERYGMTETSMIASNPYDAERRPGTVGMPLPFVNVRITDPANGTELPKGSDGMIEVKGPNVFQGYWQNPAKTAEDMRDDGYFITGDLGRFDQDGYLVISGRAKDLVITGGFNVYPNDLEEIIDGLPGVLESAVIGLPHGDLGEAVTAIVVAKDQACPAESVIIEAVRSCLAGFKTPKRVVFVDALPRNAMGKVQKAELRRCYAGLYTEA